MADPTLEFLDKFTRPGEWDSIIDNVPVMVPHKQRFVGEDGKPFDVEVKESDLPAILQKINDKEAHSGVVVVGTDGHRPKDPAKPKPNILSYYRNAHLGTWGPKARPAILMTEYVKKGCKELADHRPFRSPEYYKNSQELTAVARIVSDPKLDMGMVLAYERDTGRYLYAIGEEDMPTSGDPTQPPVTSAQEAEDDQFIAKLMRVLPQCLAKCMPEAGQKPAQPPAASGVPTMPETQAAAAAEYTRQDAAADYAKMEALLAQARQETAGLRLDYGRERAAGVVNQLVRAGIKFGRTPEKHAENVKKEVEKLATLTEAGRVERVQEIMELYERTDVAPVDAILAYTQDGKPLSLDSMILQGPVDYAGDEGEHELTAAQVEKACDYSRTHPGCSEEEAENYARGVKKKPAQKSA